MEPLLQLTDVTKEYATSAETLCVLAGVSLALARGESLAITGPSGSGKSTLLHLIAALDTPTSGSIRVEGIELASLSAAEIQQYRAQRVGLVFQDHRLFPQLTAAENIQVPTLAAGCRQNQARAADLLAATGMTARGGSYAWQLSGGERQRIAIARALINGATLLLCDEPTGNLDRENAKVVADLLLDLPRQRQIGMVLVTHNLELAARCSRHLELRDGRIGTPQRAS